MLPTKTILEIEDIQKIEPDLNTVRFLSFDIAKDVECIVFAKSDRVLHIVTTNNKTDKVNQINREFEDKSYKTKLYYTSPAGFEQALTWYDKIHIIDQKQKEDENKQLQARGKNAIDMIKKVFEKRHTMISGDFVMEIIRLSFQTGASDLHFQPEEKGVVMRLRIDGTLHNILTFTHKNFYPYGKKIKFIAGTKMNVEYIPQDGRFSVDSIDKNGHKQKIDIRASFMPGILSESIVLRFLDSTKAIQDFENLGFKGRNLIAFEKSLKHNFGLILITGPTGSGKTTTLYSVLQTKNDGKSKIITLEDPVEYNISGIQQSQINYKKGYDYANGLKACMRHDPDVLLVGETRTLETAETVVNAALTGHLVFTTVHTNNSIEAITRFLSMGIKSYVLAPSLIMIQAQRLVRHLCPHCLSKRKATKAEIDYINTNLENIQKNNPDEYGSLGENFKFDGQVPVAVGCEHCNNLGYKGRVAVMEVLSFDDDMKEAINDNITEKELLKIARKKGFLTIQEDAIIKMLKGITTIEEVRKLL